MKKDTDQNQSDAGQEAQKPEKKAARRKRNRKVLIYTLSGVAFLLLVVVPLLLNIFADRIIGRTLSEIIHRESHGRYALEFSNVSLNAFSNDISFDTVYLIPDSSLKNPETSGSETFAEIIVPSVKLKGASWLRSILYRELVIEDFNIENPVINFNIVGPAGDTIADSAVQAKQPFDYHHLHGYIDAYLDLLRIERFNFDKGSLHFTFKHDTITDTIEIKNLSIGVNNFHIDSMAWQHTERLFFSDSLNLLLKNGSFSYRSPGHEISFTSLNIASSRKRIVVKNLEISKDSVLASEHESWYDAHIGQLDIEGVDPTKIMETGALKLQAITLTGPEVVFHPAQKNKKAEKPLPDLIYDEVTRYFEPVEINHIHIENGNFNVPGIYGNGMAGIRVPNVQLTLQHLRIDSASFDQRKDFFFLDGIGFENSDQVLDFPKSGLKISYSKLSLGTADNNIAIDDLNIVKKPDGKNTHFEIRVPHFRAEAASLKNNFIQKVADFSLLELDNPVVDVVPPEIKSGKKSGIYQLQTQLPETLQRINIGQLKINNADLSYGKKGGLVVSGITSLDISRFFLAHSESEKDRIFYSDAIVSKIRNLKVEIPGMDQQVSAATLWLNTEKSQFEAVNFTTDTLPFSSGNGRQVIARVDSLELSGVDFLKLYRAEGLFADAVLLCRPDILLTGVPEKHDADQSGNQNQNWKFGEFEISNGRFATMPDKHSKPVDIEEVNVALTDFRPGNGEERPLEASGADISLDGISFLLPDSLHQVKAGKFTISSSDSSIAVSRLHISRPEGVHAENKTFEIEIPGISIRKIPVLDLYRKNVLNARSIRVNAPQLNFTESAKPSDQATFKDFDPEMIRNELLKVFEAVDVDTIAVADAALEHNSGEQISRTLLEGTGIDLTISDFEVNPQTPMTRENLLFASGISLVADSILDVLPEENNMVLIHHLSLSTPNNSFSIGQLSLEGDEIVGQQPSDVKLNNVKISGIDYHTLVSAKKIDIDQIEIDRPDMVIRQPEDTGEQSENDTMEFNAYDLIKKHFHEFKAGDIRINQARLNIHDQKPESSRSYLFEQIDFRLKHILIDSTNRIFDDKFLYSDNLSFTIRNYSETTADSLYDFGASLISFNSQDALLKVDSGFLSPNFSDSVFAARVGVETDRMDLVFSRLRLKNFDMAEFLTSNDMRIGTVDLEGLHGDDYRSKAYPLPPNHFPVLPVTALQSLDFTLQVDTFNVRNSEFTYREYVPPALQPGRIWFSNLNVTGTNITNDSALIAQDPHMIFGANARLMGEATTYLDLDFRLNSDYDVFTANATIDDFDLTHLNPMLEHVAFVKVTKGFNQNLEMSFSANNDQATGEMDFRYNKLHIRLIDKETLTDKGFGESIASFIANTFVVRRNNPKLLIFFRDGDIYFKRDKKKSFFNYLAKSALSGAKSTIRGGNEMRKEKRQKRNMERQVRKEGRLDDKSMREMSKESGSQGK